MLVFLALGNAKVLSFALGDAKVPNANDFVSQWNIGYSSLQSNVFDIPEKCQYPIHNIKQYTILS